MATTSRSYAVEICLLIPLALTLFFAEYKAFSGPVENMNRSLRMGTSVMNVHSFSEPASSKILPMLNETGGLIVFLHIAKSGGTTIRRDFSDEARFPNVKVFRAFREENVKELEGKIEWHLSSSNDDEKKTLLLEIHGGHGQPMTVFDIHNYIQEWRKQAAANNKKVFVFTLLREPTSFYVSYFNFFKHPDCHYTWCDRPLMELTEENLLSSMVPNHQCQYLTRKHDKEGNRANPVSMSECQSAYQLLRADADWVGTTEDMQQTTLPLLSYMLTGNAETGRSLTAHNKQSSDSRLTVKELSEDALRKIRDASTLDQFLYNSAKAAR